MSDLNTLLATESFIELGARARVQSLLDNDSMHELLGPFDRVKSPWLQQQGLVAQADDGVVVAKGTIDGKPVVVAAIEGEFQGGSMGEVSGAKIAAALELAVEDNRNGIPALRFYCWKQVACVCKKPTWGWLRLPIFTRPLSSCAAYNRLLV